MQNMGFGKTASVAPHPAGGHPFPSAGRRTEKLVPNPKARLREQVREVTGWMG